jgi:hypothetical protein
MGRALILVESSRISLSIIVVVRREGGFHRWQQVDTGDRWLRATVAMATNVG